MNRKTCYPDAPELRVRRPPERHPAICRSFSSPLNRAEKDIVLFLSGGIGYGLVEVLWRGRTHPSMVLCGGTCLLILTKINTALSGKNLFLRAALCGTAITAVEFATGCIVNLGLKLAVWDYSKQPFQLLGQICLLYSFFWFLFGLAVSAGMTLWQKRTVRKKTAEKETVTL
ncbi:MAG: hypothetical protein KBS76_05980 [Ruminococcus sp.]|nr:hypothetical protein [Candidatus Apopatosoma intestinale]